MSSSSPSPNTGKFVVSDAGAVDLAKSSHPIATGVGFLDHMIDQFNSHAQVGVGLTVARRAASCGGDGDDKGADGEGSSSSGGTTSDADDDDKNRLSEPADDQADLMTAVGTALGSELKKVLDAKVRTSGAGGAAAARSSRFCCPLDEALVECTLSAPAPDEAGSSAGGTLADFTLPPYGIYPAGKGRSRIGRMVTAHLRLFFEALASSSGLVVTLRKVRGDNGHHVVESAFKALSRALRNLIDGTDTGSASGEDSGAGGGAAFEKMWGVRSDSYAAGVALGRSADLTRSTKETSIAVALRLDWMHAGVSVSTGVPALDRLLTTLAHEAKMSLDIQCKGDTWVDDHHTSEDVAIAIGQCLNKALGTKAGLNRMWCAVGTAGAAEVEVTMDLSNRPCLTHDLSLSSNVGGEEYVGSASSPPGADAGVPLSVEMFEHVLDSLVSQGQMTVHVVQRNAGSTVEETATATAVAFGRALRLCAAVDTRRAGKTASSKGTLSV